jgi:hypothetical protein
MAPKRTVELRQKKSLRHIPPKTEMRQIYSMLYGAFLRRNVKLGGYLIKEAKISKVSSG